jgi:hypothetical protein
MHILLRKQLCLLEVITTHKTLEELKKPTGASCIESQQNLWVTVALGSLYERAFFVVIGLI